MQTKGDMFATFVDRRDTLAFGCLFALYWYNLTSFPEQPIPVPNYT